MQTYLTAVMPNGQAPNAETERWAAVISHPNLDLPLRVSINATGYDDAKRQAAEYADGEWLLDDADVTVYCEED